MSNRRLPTTSNILLAFAACILATVACNFPITIPSVTTTPATPTPSSEIPTSTSTPIAFTPPAPGSTPQPTPTSALPFPDANAIFEGVCFQYLRTLGGQTITLNSQADLNGFYNKVDESELCRGRIERKPFDFSVRQIVGTAIIGEGCSIDLTYERTDQDNSRKQRNIVLRAVVSGDCPYELVRPVWVIVERPTEGYTTQIQVSTSP